MSPDPHHRHLVPPTGWLDDAGPDDEGPSAGFLLGVTVLAAVLRLWEITGPSLWVDEIMTWNMIRPGIGFPFLEQITDSIQGPLYMAVAWPLVRMMEAEWALRLPSAVAGILAVPLFAAVAALLVPGRATRLAVLLFALNPFHVWYSQEGRGYAFLILFSLAAAWLYLDMVRRGPTVGRVVLFALAGAAAALGNLSALFLWGGMGLSLLVLDRPSGGRQWGLWTLGFGLAVVLVSPWLLKASGVWAVDRALPGGTGEALRGATTFDPLALPYTVQTFLYGFSLGPATAELHGPDRLEIVKSSALILGLGALPVGLGLLGSLGRPGRPLARLFLWVLVPSLILVFLAVRNIKPWNPRYVAMALPWILIMVASGLTIWPRRAGFGLTLVLLGLTLWSLGNYFGNGRYAKADLRGAVAFVEDSGEAGDPVLVPSVTGVYDFYQQGTARTIDTYGRPPLKTMTGAEAFLAEVLVGEDACWFVSARAWFFDPEDLLPVALARIGHLRVRKELDGVAIYHWERNSPAKDNHGP